MEKRERQEEFLDWQRREDIRREAAMRDLLKDHPDILSEYQAKIAEIRTR